MRFLRVLFLLLLVAGLAIALAWQLFSAPISDYARRMLERRLAAAVDLPVSISSLRISLLPPAVEVEGAEIGPDGVALRVAVLGGRLLPYRSLWQLRPVADVAVDELSIDPAAFPHREQPVKVVESVAEGSPLPFRLPFRVRRLEVTAGRLVVPLEGAPLTIWVGSLTGDLEAGLPGRLSLGFSAADVKLERGGRSLVLDYVRAKGRDTRRGWVVRDVVVLADGIAITAGVERGRPERQQVRADIALRRLAVLGKAFASLGGRALATATLTGPLTRPDVEVALSVEGLSVLGRPLGNLTAKLSGEGGRLELSSGLLVGLGGELALTGSMKLAGPFAYDLEAAWRDIDAAEVARLLGASGVAPLVAYGSAEISGAVRPPAVAAEARGGLRRGNDPEELLWTAGGQYEEAGARAELRGTMGTVNALRADVAIGRSGELGGSAELQMGDTAAVQAFLMADDLPQATGSFAAAVRIAGTASRPRLAGQISGRRFALYGVAVDEIDGTFAVDPDSFRTDGLVASVGGGEAQIAGTFAFSPERENRWQVEVREVDGEIAAQLVGSIAGRRVPVGGGEISAHLSGGGPWSQIVLTGEAEWRDMQVAGEPFDRLSADLDVEWPRWSTRAELVRVRGEQLDARLSGSSLEEIDLELRGEDLSLEGMRTAAQAGISGSFTVRADLQGPPRALSGEFALVAHRLAAGERSVGSVSVEGEAAQGAWRLRATALDGGVEIVASVDGAQGFPFRGSAEWENVDLASLLTGAADVRVDSSGSLRLDGRLSYPEDVDGELRVDELRIARGSYQLAASQPIVVRGEHGVFTVEPFELQGGGSQLRLGGTLRSSGLFDLAAQGSGDLGLLEALGDPIDSARGRFQLDARVVHPQAAEWNLDGSASLENVTLDVGLPVVFEQTDARLVLAGSTVRIDELRGRAGGGTFGIEGEVDFERGPNLTWHASEVAADPAPSLEIQASGKGTVRGPWRDLVLAGDVRILQALYDRDIGFADLLPSFNRALARAPQTGGSGRRIRVDVRVKAPQSLYVANNLANIEAGANLVITGMVQRPLLQGQVQVVEGKVFFGGRTFDIVDGGLTFLPAMNNVAAINFNAETTIDTDEASYTVYIRATGTTADYRVHLSSDDGSLTETDIASLIAFGKTVAQLQQGTGSGFSVSSVIGFAGGQLGGLVSRQAQGVLPFDRIEFEPGFSRATGQFEPQIKVGKDLTDNLSAWVAQTFGVQSQTAMQADYQLTPRLSAVLSWESETASQEGAFGGDIKFRYRYWRLPRFSLFGGGGGGGAESDAE